MSGLVATGERNLVLVSGRAHVDLAHAVGGETGCGVSPMMAYDFASGEIYVRSDEFVRGASAFVLQSIEGDINKWTIEQLIIIDAAKRASAKHITVAAPFYPYSRQDKKHQGREPISARLMADLYWAAGADHIMSVDLHALQGQGFSDGLVNHLSAMPVFVGYMCGRVDLTNTAIVSPDAGRIRVAEKWPERLGGAPPAFVHKTRNTTRPNVAVTNRVTGGVVGKECILVDDIIDTAGTITEAVNIFNNADAKKVIIVTTYGILSDPVMKRLSESGAAEVVVTDTPPVPAEKRFEQLTILSIVPLLARMIQGVFEDGSIISLFN